MKKLIVNADDFGYSFGVNKGIVEAHSIGIVTSTSVMVQSIAAKEAADLARYPNLSVGLHFVTGELNNTRTDLDEQMALFQSLTGKLPTHIDIHKVKEEDIELKSIVSDYAQERGIPFRYSGEVHFISSFFGPHADGDVSINQLKKSLEECRDGVNELMCHVGHVDDYLKEHSSYSDLRAEELQSICDPEAKRYLDTLGITLVSRSA